MLKLSNQKVNIAPRKGCRDIWNLFMVKGATFSPNDIPFCPTTAKVLPKVIITWNEAKDIYMRHMKTKKRNFHVDAFVCWYIDDYKFDALRKGIWRNYNYVLKVLRHFTGVITPDFSTYQDFPEPLKLWNTYRMRAFGYWLGKNGVSVINNVRWGTPETWRYCFDGIPQNSIVAIGTCGGSPRKLIDRERFEKGLDKLVDVLSPHTIIVYGSANYPCFRKLVRQGVKIVSYPSKTAQVFAGRKGA